MSWKGQVFTETFALGNAWVPVVVNLWSGDWLAGEGRFPNSSACCTLLHGGVFEGSWSVTVLTTPFLQLQRHLSPQSCHSGPWSLALGDLQRLWGCLLQLQEQRERVSCGAVPWAVDLAMTQPHTMRTQAEEQHGAAWAIPQALLLDRPCPVAKTAQVSKVFDGRPEQISCSSEFHSSIWKLRDACSWLTAYSTQCSPSFACRSPFSCSSCLGSPFAFSECHSAVLGQQWPTYFWYRIKTDVRVVQRENWNTHEN